MQARKGVKGVREEGNRKRAWGGDYLISVAGGAVARVTLYSRVAKQPITVSLSTLTEHFVCRIQQHR